MTAVALVVAVWALVLAWRGRRDARRRINLLEDRLWHLTAPRLDEPYGLPRRDPQ